ncbi:hypothetical protein AC1031_009641 [Aphanomyces cochlioides]|nr:hypothetical protein AC1031_009641 [Aphanomyces cochlioides]
MTEIKRLLTEYHEALEDAKEEKKRKRSKMDTIEEANAEQIKKSEKIDINTVLRAMTDAKDAELKIRQRELELKEIQITEDAAYKKRMMENEAKSLELELRKAENDAKALQLQNSMMEIMKQFTSKG